MLLFFGYIGEYYYFSLRFKYWERIWLRCKIFVIILCDKFYEECLYFYFIIIGLYLVFIYVFIIDLGEVSLI